MVAIQEVPPGVGERLAIVLRYLDSLERHLGDDLQLDRQRDGLWAVAIVRELTLQIQVFSHESALQS